MAYELRIETRTPIETLTFRGAKTYVDKGKEREKIKTPLLIDIFLLLLHLRLPFSGGGAHVWWFFGVLSPLPNSRRSKAPQPLGVSILGMSLQPYRAKERYAPRQFSGFGVA